MCLGPSQEEVLKAAAEHRAIPPHHADATVAADAYRWARSMMELWLGRGSTHPSLLMPTQCGCWFASDALDAGHNELLGPCRAWLPAAMAEWWTIWLFDRSANNMGKVLPAQAQCLVV